MIKVAEEKRLGVIVGMLAKIGTDLVALRLAIEAGGDKHDDPELRQHVMGAYINVNEAGERAEALWLAEVNAHSDPFLET